MIDLQRRIILLPDKKIGAKITTDKEDYSPGEQVTIQVELDDKLSAHSLDKDEKAFASIVVTDVSSYYRVPKHQLGPTLPSMVFLERDVEQTATDDKGEFLYWQDFVAPFFSSANSETDPRLESQHTENFKLQSDLLLGT